MAGARTMLDVRTMRDIGTATKERHRMDALKTMHDARTMRSVITRAMPMNEGAIFLQLHRLSGEKLRLEKELGLWQRKKVRIEVRLGEIAQQMDALRQHAPTMRTESPAPEPVSDWRTVPLDY